MRVADPAQPIGQLPAPTNLLAKVSDFRGAVELNWDPVHGSRNYTVYINETDPQDDKAWVPVHATTKSKATITDLDPGSFYFFKVAAYGTAGLGPASDVAEGLAA